MELECTMDEQESFFLGYFCVPKRMPGCGRAGCWIWLSKGNGDLLFYFFIQCPNRSDSAGKMHRAQSFPLPWPLPRCAPLGLDLRISFASARQTKAERMRLLRAQWSQMHVATMAFLLVIPRFLATPRKRAAWQESLSNPSMKP